jgi:hypothetical protein
MRRPRNRLLAAITTVFLLGGLLAAGGLAAPAPVLASELQVLDWTLGYQVQYDINGNRNQTAYTAEFSVRVDDFSDMVAYCVDLYQTIDKGQTYKVNLDPVLAHPVSTLQAAWLLGHYAPGLGLVDSSVSLKAGITALQIAIWEVIYDHASTDLASGRFVLKNVYGSESALVQQLARQYLASLPDEISSTGLTIAGVARSGKVQDLLYGNKSSGATPEPGSMLLLGSAAACLGWLRWRRSVAQG